LVGDLDHHGWVTDFSVIGSALTPILTQLDHHQLNDVPGLDNPTCEVLARWIHERLRPHLPNLAWVKINETPTSSCLYRTPEATCPS
jgi:6-pyruvoyltetrahydropterin/6-carboxytetrahydropterin synthase